MSILPIIAAVFISSSSLEESFRDVLVQHWLNTKHFHPSEMQKEASGRDTLFGRNLSGHSYYRIGVKVGYDYYIYYLEVGMRKISVIESMDDESFPNDD